MQGPSLRKRQINQTPGRQIYVVGLSLSAAEWSQCLSISQEAAAVGQEAAVCAASAVGLVLEVAGNGIFRLQQITFLLVVLLLGGGIKE